MPLSWSKSCSLSAIVKNIANECGVKVSFRKRHAGKFYTGTVENVPHGVLSIASPEWEQVSKAVGMASDFTLELRQAGVLQDQGLAPEPEGAAAENTVRDISAAPEADNNVVWEPVTEKGVIVGWQRQGAGGSDPASGASGSTSGASGSQAQTPCLPPVPTVRQQMPLVSSAEDAEARGMGWIQHIALDNSVSGR